MSKGALNSHKEIGYWIMSEVRQTRTLICSDCRLDLGSICPTNYCPNCGQAKSHHIIYRK